MLLFYNRQFNRHSSLSFFWDKAKFRFSTWELKNIAVMISTVKLVENDDFEPSKAILQICQLKEELSYNLKSLMLRMFRA